MKLLRLSIFCFFLWGGLTSQVAGQCSFSIKSIKNKLCVNELAILTLDNKPAGVKEIIWQVGSKQVKNLDTARVLFLNKGKYDVKVSVTLADNSVCTTEKKELVVVHPLPDIGELKARPLQLCQPNEELTLRNTSIDAVKWTFIIEGKYYQSTTGRVDHTYKITGYPIIQMVVENAIGCKNSHLFDSTLLVLDKPEVTIPEKIICSTPGKYNISPTINLKNAPITSYEWTFEGATNNTSSLKTPSSITYNKAGIYNIGLKMGTDKGCTYTYKFPKHVTVTDINKITLEGIPSVKNCITNLFFFDLDNINLDPSYYEWEFDEEDVLRAEETSRRLTIEFRTPGVKTVSVIIKTPDCNRKITTTITVRPFPQVSFKAKDCFCQLPDSLILTNTSDKTNKLNYSWRVHGGGINLRSTDKRGAFLLSDTGRYIVSLVGVDDKNCAISRTKEIHIKQVKIEPDYFTFAGCFRCASIEFNDELMCATNGKSANWYIFDSTNTLVLQSKKDTSMTLGLNDLAKGTYSLSFVYDNGSGCKDSVYYKHFFTIANCLKALNLKIDTNHHCAGEITVPYYFPQTDSIGRFFDVFLIHPTTKAKIPEIIEKRAFHYVKFKAPDPGIYDMEIIIHTQCGNSSTYTLKNRVFVNKLTIEAEMGKPRGCIPNRDVPLLIKKIDHQFYSTHRDTSLKVNWRIYGSGYINEPDKFTSMARIGIEIADVELRVRNSLGCSALKQFKNAGNIILPKMSIPENLCFHDTIFFKNKTIGNFNTPRWTSSNPKDSFLPNDTVANPQFIPFNEGKRTIYLSMTDDYKCRYSTSDDLKLIDVKMGFSVADTSAKCSPALYEFNVSGDVMKKYIWDFGDGDSIKSPQRQVFKIFDLSRITPYRNTFDVKLVGLHATGCQKTFLIKDLIRINGPWIDVKALQTTGCAPLDVSFANNSQNIKNIYIDYGDDKSADSTINNHIFDGDTSQEITKYVPLVVATDKASCQAKFHLEDTIKVYSRPVARFTGNPKKGCSPQAVQLSSHSKYARSFSWEIPKANMRFKTESNQFILTEGVYDVSLMVSNALNCKDQILKSDFFTVHPSPIADFKVTDSIGCTNQKLYFINKSTDKNAITSHTWISKINNTTDSIVQNENFTYITDQKGFLSVKLIVENIFGCLDTHMIEDAMNIYDTFPKQSSTINFVSHNSNKEMQLNWPEPDARFINEVEIYEWNTLTEQLLGVEAWHDTTYLHQSSTLDKEAHCYRLKLVDKCRMRHISEAHCSIHLDTDTTEKRVTKLDWSPYLGWDSISHYTVFRSSKNLKYYPIATIPSFQLSYIDTSFCDSLYSYTVVASKAASTFQSESNSVRYQPEFTYQDQPLELYLSTVVDDEEIKIHWEETKQLGAIKYVISKTDKFGAKNRTWQETNQLFITDKNVDVDRKYYDYQVKVVDQCGHYSPESNIGRSILVDADPRPEEVYVHWNSYYKWANGVLAYQLERRKPNDSIFEILTSTQDTFFVDMESPFLYEEAYEYRVIAIENGETPDSSYSNIQEIIPATSIYSPSAFSPNGDGVNDQFHIQGWALLDEPENIKAFDLKIFNRWGELIFHSNDLNLGWDGTFNGEACPLDQYVWVAKATGVDGKAYFLNGGLSLLR